MKVHYETDMKRVCLNCCKYLNLSQLTKLSNLEKNTINFGIT